MCNEKLKEIFNGKLEKEETVFYYLDLGLIIFPTISYSFGKDERNNIQEKLKKEALENIIQKGKYTQDGNLSWIDYKRFSIGNMFDSKEKAEEKLKQILELLKCK